MQGVLRDLERRYYGAFNLFRYCVCIHSIAGTVEPITHHVGIIE